MNELEEIDIKISKELVRNKKLKIDNIEDENTLLRLKMMANIGQVEKFWDYDGKFLYPYYRLI